MTTTHENPRPLELEQHLDVLRQVALKIARNLETAEDLVQDTLEIALQQGDALPEAGRQRAWLVRVMHNRFLSDVRRWSSRNVIAMPALNEVAAPRVEEEQRSPWEHITPEMYQQAVQALDSRFRLPYQLKTVEGWSYKRIAAHLQLKDSTVGTRIKRAREQLMQRLTRED